MVYGMDHVWTFGVSYTEYYIVLQALPWEAQGAFQTNNVIRENDTPGTK